MSEPGYQRMIAVVRGHVQGVFFRAHTREVARQLRLTGWVANQADGTVRVVAEGPRPALEALRAWLRQGPPLARVEEVQVEWAEAAGEFRDFYIRG
jgi:acylphosphatase